MTSYNKYHQRVNSDPSRITDWHVRHRSLSLTARMHANIHMPASPTRPDSADRNTGFPEPLSSDRNTTLRHPDADTSPDACIESHHHIDLARSHVRQALLRERHALRALRHGKITVDTSYSNLSSADGTADSGYGSALPVEKEAPVSFLPESGELAESPLPSPSPSSSPNSFGQGVVRHSEDLVREKNRASTDSMSGRKGFMGRIHTLRHRSQGSRG